MTTERTVDVEAICDRPLKLFLNGDNAWNHMKDHALGMRHNGEEQGWGLLISALEAELKAGRLEDVRKVAQASSLHPFHPRLGPIYSGFLDRIQRGVELASRLNWYWEAKPGEDCRWMAFGREGIFAALDEDYVRTGYLPESDSTRWSGDAENAHFRLFLACLARVQAKFNYAVKSRRVEKPQPALLAVLRSGLTEVEWVALP